MNIITLFCEIDDFILAYETWVSPQCLPETIPLETRGRPRRLHPSEVTTILKRFLAKQLSDVSAFGAKDTSASIDAPSFHIW